MKDQRNKPATTKSEASSSKSLDALYHELLELREEVREVEQRFSRNTSKKPPGKIERDS